MRLAGPSSNVQGSLFLYRHLCISTLVVTLKSRYVLKTHISDLAYSLSLHEARLY